MGREKGNVCQLQSRHIRKKGGAIYSILTILMIELRTVFALKEEGREKENKDEEELEATVSPSQC